MFFLTVEEVMNFSQGEIELGVGQVISKRFKAPSLIRRIERAIKELNCWGGTLHIFRVGSVPNPAVLAADLLRGSAPHHLSFVRAARTHPKHAGNSTWRPRRTTQLDSCNSSWGNGSDGTNFC